MDSLEKGRGLEFHLSLPSSLSWLVCPSACVFVSGGCLSIHPSWKLWLRPSVLFCPQPTDSSQGAMPRKTRPAPAPPLGIASPPPPAPPQDPMTGVCGLLRFGSLTKLADWAAEKRGVVRGSVSSLRLALQSVLCPVTPGRSVRRGRPTLDTGGESAPHFSFSPVIPSSRLCSVCGCST